MNIGDLIDVEGGLQKKQIHSDKDLYKLEMERIFARSWLFLTHESAIPNPGDYFSTYMGEDAVIVVRGADGQIRAFINSCTHRGARVCHAEAGNTRAFVCPYHGWTFGIDGGLRGVPSERAAYGEGGLDKKQLGLTEVAKVDSYAGFVFGCFDPEAPTLRDYLGDITWYMDTFTARAGIELLGPPVKSVLHCNWKVPSENFLDGYHVGWTHQPALKVLGGPLVNVAGNANLREGGGFMATTRYGHGTGITSHAAAGLHRPPDYQNFVNEKRPEVAALLGDTRAGLYGSHMAFTIFPNCSFLHGTNVWKVWMPRGPNEIEVWTWTMVEKDMSPDLKRKVQKETMRGFATAGIFETDDSDNFQGITAAVQGFVTQRGNMNATMGTHYDTVHEEMPGQIGDFMVTEIATRGYYGFYKDILESENWAELEKKRAD